LILVLGQSIEARNALRDFLLTPSSAGRITLGMRKEDVRRVYRDHDVEEVDLSFEGPPGSAPALDISKGEESLLVADLNDKGKVYRISTGNPKFTTKEGIRVGSTLGEAKRYFGKPAYVERRSLITVKLKRSW